MSEPARNLHPAQIPPPASGQVQPHNLDAEASLLGAMLLTTEAIVDATEVLEAEHFYQPIHQQIFAAIVATSKAGGPVDFITVAATLESRGVLTQIGGTARLLALGANTPVATNAAGYAAIVHKHAVMRGLVATGHEIVALGQSSPEDAQKALDEAEMMVFKLAERRSRNSLAPIDSLLEGSLDRLEALFEQGDAITGTPTGFTDLDKMLAGLQPSSLVVVGARPAMGKTSFALNIAAHAAMEADRPTLIFSLEMSHLELTNRILCSDARVNASNIRNGRLQESDWKKIGDAVKRVGESPLWIDDNPNITVGEIRAQARRLKSKEGDLGLVVVDYLQLMTGRTSAENRQVEVAEISRGLKILARELECPVVALSQLSRGLEQRQDKRPMLADLRESGAIEQDADVVMFLYRDEVYNAESPDLGTAEILIAKHRSGPTGVVRLAFLPHYTRFANMARGA